MIDSIIALAAISIVSSLANNYIFKKFAEKNNLKELSENIKKLGKSKDLNDKLKALEIYSEYLTKIMKPLLFSSLVSIGFFILVYFLYGDLKILKIPSFIPIIGEKVLTGIWLYIILTLIFSLLLRKYGSLRYL